MISVCIATYNGEKYIKEQLESILTQLNNQDEVIISDDGSQDNTLAIIQSLKSPLIKIYKNKKKHGYTANFENALRHAKGDYIFLSDQDDIWMSNKVCFCIEKLQHHDLVATDATIIDDKGQVINSSFFKLRCPQKGLLGNLIKFGYLGCCLAFRRKIVEKALPFPHKHNLCTHDNWIFLIAQCFYRTAIIDIPLLHYRRHNLNASSGAINQHKSILFRIHYRLYIIWQLIKRI